MNNNQLVKKRQGGVGGTAKGGRTPMIADASAAEGFFTSEIAKKRRDAISKWGIPQKAFTAIEKQAVTAWINSKGNMNNFLDLVAGDDRFLAVLQSEKVQKAIEFLAKKGDCLSLVASKEELSMRMTALLRDREATVAARLEAADEIARLNGLYPDRNNGGVSVQIILTEGLGQS